MPLQVYSTLSRKKEPFPKKPGETVTIGSSLSLEITPTQGFFAEANFA